ncbi:hypothetical protein PC9H_001754 [Pleurotus ostreatus]|uniref:Uncharacterized protein n=2 Tax=Pleurotus ostreatus TaxID=5322 RepID=A0A067PEE5_PLEO1|nr:uncharacterized protein PC9H_001754 [Pleurotus ostreatus]KAF7441404.1 hypothetical protein PC9H_001754 [Pleurotus ostreatus]KDQ34241.1 hypothetical protein PLEOSDRAFT_1033503 [Pleurotus ostreatus PC15]
MYTNNPYAQAGWPNAANRGSRSSNEPPASTFGALPYYVPPSQTNTLFFQFTSFSPDIMNCTVLGPQNQPYFRVITDTPTPGFSVLQNGQGKNFAFIEWRSHPLIDMKGVVPKQRIGDWIPLSSDKKYRTMRIGDKQYAWVPNGQYISLTTVGNGPPEVLAKVSSNSGVVFLEVTSQAINLGLLEASVVVTLLLMCGRNVD